MACKVSPGDPATSGDTLYGERTCQRWFIDWALSEYDIDKGNWDQGWGYENKCDLDRPLARTLNAIWCLEYSAPDSWDDRYDKNKILNWAGRYARENIDELDGSGTCDWSPIARTVRHVDDYVNLYLPFFYTWWVSNRAGTLIHEARHSSGVDHDDDPNDSSWDYGGAWRYHVCWLAQFMQRCENSSEPMKQQACQRVNAILANCFTRDPGFRISESGAIGPKCKDGKESKDGKEGKEASDDKEPDGKTFRDSKREGDRGGVPSVKSEPPGVQPAAPGDLIGPGATGGTAAPFIRPEERPDVLP